MTQLAFYFEQKYCTGCKTCQIACMDKHDLKPNQSYRKVQEVDGGEFTQNGGAYEQHVYAFYIMVSCNHCKDPACMKVCPVKAIQKRTEDGVVLIDQRSCIGCQRCVSACPYGAIQFDGEKRKAGKCDFCIDDIKAGRKPACVAACPMRALECGELDELRCLHGDCSQTQGMPDPKKTQPSLVIMPNRHALVD